MKKLLIYIAAMLLSAGNLWGAQFEAAMLFNVEGSPIMDSVTVSVYDLAGNLECDTTWGYVGADHGNVPTSYDSSYGFIFTTTTIEQYKIVAIGHIAGHPIQRGKYYMWPTEPTVVLSSDGINIIRNGNFEVDSVSGIYRPSRWSSYSGWGDFDSCEIITSNQDDGWCYRMQTTEAKSNDTIIMYNQIAELNPGHYLLSGTITDGGGANAFLAIDTGSINESEFMDSLLAGGNYLYRSRVFTIYKTQGLTLYIVMIATTTGGWATFDNISITYLSPLSFVSADTSKGGYSVTDSGQYFHDTSGTREEEYQGFTSMTPADIAQANWRRLISSDNTEAGSYAKFFWDTLDAKTSGVTATVSDGDKGDIADSVQRRMQSVERSLNLVYNGGFEDDSVAGASPPDIWAVAYGVHANNGVVSATADKRVSGRWMHMLKSTGADTVIIYQDLETVPVGIYRFSGTVLSSGGDSAGIFLEDKDGMPDSNSWYESINATAAAYNPFSKIVTITTESKFSIGLYLFANSADDYAYFDDVSFQYIAPLWFVAADTLTSGSTVSFFDAAIDSVMGSVLVTLMNAGVITAEAIHNNAFLEEKFGTYALSSRVHADNFLTDAGLATSAAEEIANKVGDIATVTYAGIDSTAAANPTHFYGQSGAAGDGTDLLTYYAADTTNDNYVEATLLTIFNTAGEKIGTKYTSSSGCAVLTLITGNTYYIQGYGPRLHHWEPEDTIVMGASETTDSIVGWYTDVSVAAVAKHCDVTITVFNTDGSKAKGVDVEAKMLGDALVDSSGYPLSNPTLWKETDSDGQVVFTCIWSSYALWGTDTNIKWRFQVHARGRGELATEVIIPRQTSYELTF